MQLPLQITFRHMEPSEAVEANIREKADKLESFASNIMSCRVVVEAPHKHHHKGKVYHVSVDIKLPGGEVAVSHDPGINHAHEDIYVAIRDAFNAARRQLEDYTRKQRQKIKHHETPGHGRVVQINPDDDYGMIETPDGREIYFHRNSLVGADFGQLETGAEVRFDEEAGDKGPQASTVKLVGKHHLEP